MINTEELFFLLFHVRILFPFATLFLLLVALYPFIRSSPLIDTRLFLKFSNVIVAFSAAVPSVFLLRTFGNVGVFWLVKMSLIAAPDIAASVALGTTAVLTSHISEAMQKAIVPLVFLSAILGAPWFVYAVNRGFLTL